MGTWMAQNTPEDKPDLIPNVSVFQNHLPSFSWINASKIAGFIPAAIPAEYQGKDRQRDPQASRWLPVVGKERFLLTSCWLSEFSPSMPCAFQHGSIAEGGGG